MKRFFRLLATSLVLFANIPAWTLTPGGSQAGNLRLHCDHESLRNVLKIVSDQGGTGFMFQDDLVEGRTVTCSFDDLSLDQALERILSPLSISFKRIPSGPVVLYDAGTAERLIRGWVVDASSGNGLPFANIVQEGTSSGTTSDTDGSFVLRNSHPDSCTIRVSYIGYRPEQIQLRSTHGQDSIRIAMQERPIETKCVDVEADRTPDLEIAAHPGVISFSPQEMDYIPSAEGSSFGRTLQMLPGADGALDHASVLGFHGGSEYENLVLLDGIPMRKTDTYFGFLGPLHPRMIEKVTIQNPATYGDQAGGIIELTGNTVPQNRFNAGIGADMFSSNAFVEWPVLKNGRLFLGARKSHGDILNGRYYGPISDFLIARIPGSHANDVNLGDFWVTPSRRYSFSDVAGKFVYSGPGRNRFGSTFFFKHETDRASASLNDLGEKLFRDNFQRVNNYGLSVNWEHVWNHSLKTTWTAAYGAYRPRQWTASGYHEAGRVVYQWYDIMSFYGRTDWLLKCNNRLEAGKNVIEYGFEIMQTDLVYSNKSYIQNDPPGEESQRVTWNNTTGVFNPIIYLQDRWSPVSALCLSLGLRATSFAVSSEGHYHSFFDPRISIEISPVNRFKAGIAFGTYHQFIRNYVNSSFRDPVLVNHVCWDPVQYWPPFPVYRPLVLNLKYETDRWLLAAEGYNRNYPDLWPFYFPTVEGSGSSRGMEWMIQRKTGFITGWLSYRLSRSEVRITRPDGIYRYERSTPTEMDRRNELKAVAAFNLGSVRFSLAGCFASGNPYTVESAQLPADGDWIYTRGPFNGSRLPSYQRMDVQAARQFEGVLGLKWNFTLSLLNIFDRKNVLFRSRTTVYDYLPPGLWAKTVPYDIPMLGFTPMASVGVSLK